MWDASFSVQELNDVGREEPRAESACSVRRMMVGGNGKRRFRSSGKKSKRWSDKLATEQFSPASGSSDRDMSPPPYGVLPRTAAEAAGPSARNPFSNPERASPIPIERTPSPR